MAKHVIFLVHGMGDFGKDWSLSVQKQIADSYSAYGIAKVLPFADSFEFKEIVYNERFDKLRKQWRDDSATVLATLKEGGLEASALGKLAKAGGAAGTEDQFLSSHVLDVLLYRFVPMVAEEARTLVAKQIIDTVFGAEPRKWSVIAHSLGTAVAHDSLHAMFTNTVAGETLIGTTQAQVLMMVANVSRLLEEDDVDVYKSMVRPGTSDSVCRHYLNAKHEWDPFPRPKEFRPLDDWPSVAARNEDRYVPITINAFQNKNIHGLSHYLSNPKVHVPLFRRLVPLPVVISDDELKKASALFEASTPLGQFQELQQAVKKFQIAEEATWGQIITAWQGFIDAVKAF
jgi:hypothetical protein